MGDGRRLGSNVDYLPTASSEHVRPDCLRHQEGTPQVHGEGPIPGPDRQIPRPAQGAPPRHY